ncbi:unnamed protein product [Vitrella brassicaformis CCMP3155]|uniref:Uncharacterized protein n=1 Tax=Vitrella brassicaformis (strain CCMP3155) TaxID=1169540 RepID=A0A0G4GM30_VITBC|nr:unnamed protein product [Vitrella brassicaformis CCMP3155]|eukprot:CEM31199.1 unnamed protein product [Vitrella brassicaformis CCMP3155]
MSGKKLYVEVAGISEDSMSGKKLYVEVAGISEDSEEIVRSMLMPYKPKQIVFDRDSDRAVLEVDQLSHQTLIELGLQNYTIRSLEAADVKGLFGLQEDETVKKEEPEPVKEAPLAASALRQRATEATSKDTSARVKLPETDAFKMLLDERFVCPLIAASLLCLLVLGLFFE